MERLLFVFPNPHRKKWKILTIFRKKLSLRFFPASCIIESEESTLKGAFSCLFGM